MNWMSLKNKKPPVDVDVLVYIPANKENYEGGYFLVSYYGPKANYGNDGWDQGCCGCYDSELKEATHWAFLPKPPKDNQ